MPLSHSHLILPPHFHSTGTIERSQQDNKLQILGIPDSWDHVQGLPPTQCWHLFSFKSLRLHIISVLLIPRVEIPWKMWKVALWFSNVFQQMTLFPWKCKSLQFLFILEKSGWWLSLALPKRYAITWWTNFICPLKPCQSFSILLMINDKNFNYQVRNKHSKYQNVYMLLPSSRRPLIQILFVVHLTKELNDAKTWEVT